MHIQGDIDHVFVVAFIIFHLFVLVSLAITLGVRHLNSISTHHWIRYMVLFASARTSENAVSSTSPLEEVAA